MSTLATASLLAVAALLAGCASAPGPQTDACPVCAKPVADGPDVRVVRYGESGPGTRYRCFVCPIKEGKTGDVWTLRAESGLDGKWVTFRVAGDRVESDPASAVVLALDVVPGAECLDVHRVFVDEDEFRRYVQAHPSLRAAQPLRLADVLAKERRR